MAMERVTIEQNGERFVIEVPEGTSDADIQNFVSQQQSTTSQSSSPMEYAVPQALTTAREMIGPNMTGPIAPAVQSVYNAGKSVLGYPIDVAKNALTWTPRSVAEVAMNPISTLKAYVMNHPLMESNASLSSVGKNIAQGVRQGAVPFAKNVASSVGAGLLGPESAFAAPYQMAAYEQERIRANPNAPLTNTNIFTGNQVVQDTLQNNPYAQMFRGEAKTQGQAGAMNRRTAIGSQQYGGVTPQEKATLDQDRLNRMIREAAAKKALAFPNQ